MPDLEAVIIPWIAALGILIEVAGVIVIVGGLVRATYVWLKRRGEHPYRDFRQQVGRSLLLGLEILVAADIIRTVVLELTPESLATLALLILIRTFLSWALEVEIEGRWPWQMRAGERSWPEERGKEKVP